MTEVNPEWVEAGARAIGEHRKGHGWERDEDTWRNYTQIVEWALAAVEPLIRADERERQSVALDSGAVYAAIEATRTQIISEITNYMNEQWPDKPYSEGATYHSVRSILLEWTDRIVTHIAKGGA
jgi:hypothetical protein